MIHVLVGEMPPNIPYVMRNTLGRQGGLVLSYRKVCKGPEIDSKEIGCRITRKAYVFTRSFRARQEPSPMFPTPPCCRLTETLRIVFIKSRNYLLS